MLTNTCTNSCVHTQNGTIFFRNIMLLICPPIVFQPLSQYFSIQFFFLLVLVPLLHGHHSYHYHFLPRLAPPLFFSSIDLSNCKTKYRKIQLQVSYKIVKFTNKNHLNNCIEFVITLVSLNKLNITQCVFSVSFLFRLCQMCSKMYIWLNI